MPHSNETSTNLSRPGSGLSLSVLGQYLHHRARKILIDEGFSTKTDEIIGKQQTLVDSAVKIGWKFNLLWDRVELERNFVVNDGFSFLTFFNLHKFAKINFYKFLEEY